MLQAVLFRLREGCTWRALSIFAPHTTIYTRWKQWCDSGVWDDILEALSGAAEGKLWSIDSTSCKVHKHAHGAPRSSGPQCIGSSRGGANTKVHALVDTHGNPICLSLTPGNAHDLTAAPDLVEACTSRTILADKAYDSNAFRDLLSDLGLRACIPPKSNRIDPPKFHKGHYKRRHTVENFFQRIKELRAVATRYEKLADRYLALVKLAAICTWLHF